MIPRFSIGMIYFIRKAGLNCGKPHPIQNAKISKLSFLQIKTSCSKWSNTSNKPIESNATH